MTADLGIIHSASLFLDLHGDEAVPEARKMATEMRAKGDLDGADTWLRVIVAIEDMRRGASRRAS
jgi:hypothetical protein